MSAAQSSWKPPAGDWVPPAADRQAAATPAPVEQSSAAARFFMPFVKMAADAVHYVKNPADAGPVALHLLKLAAEAAIPGYGPQVVGGEIAHGLADPIVHAVKSGDYAGAAGQATLDALMAAAPGAGELGEAAGSAAEMVGTAIKGGIKEGMTPIRYGRLNIPVPSSVAGAAAAGYAGHYLGLPAELSAAVGAVAPVVRGGVRAVRAAMAERAAAEAASEAGFGVASGTTALPTRAVSVSPGIVPEAGGLLPGMRAELEARIAAQQPPGFGVAGGSTAAPTRGVPMTPGVIPDVAGSLPGAPVAASTPVAAAPVEAPPPVAAMPSSVETLRAELEAQFRDGIARANGFKKGFESIPEHNPARQNIQATAAAIARAEQGAPEIAAAPAAAPPPLTGETPNQTPGVQLEPDFLRDEVRRQNTRARTVAEGSQEATAARASHVDDIVGSNRSNWVRKMARQFKNAGMTSEDAAALPAEDLDKVSQAVGVSPWSERSADTIDQFKAALDEMWKNAPKASQKVQDITTTGLGISGSEPTGIGGLMSRKPAAAPAPAPAPDPPPVASSQPTTAGEMMQGTPEVVPIKPKATKGRARAAPDQSGIDQQAADNIAARIQAKSDEMLPFASAVQAHGQAEANLLDLLKAEKPKVGQIRKVAADVDRLAVPLQGQIRGPLGYVLTSDEIAENAGLTLPKALKSAKKVTVGDVMKAEGPAAASIQKTVLSRLSEKPTHISEIALNDEELGELFNLELEGKVKQLPGKNFVISPEVKP